jgi:hypothetical protein
MIFRHRIRMLATAAFLAIAACAQAGGTLPPPVNGISFDEWAAGNARLANQQPMADILKVLNVNEARWNQANQAFLDALKHGDPASYTFTRYGEVFANPAVGRFKGRNDQPEIEAKLATFDDYASVQADLSVSSEFGKDPQAVLKAHNLTVYEFSQEAGNWVRVIAEASGSDESLRMTAIREKYEAEYRQKYQMEKKQ